MTQLLKPTPYFIPPADYRTVAEDGCQQCGNPICIGPLIGGVKWHHLIGYPTDHEVVLSREWWDTSIGSYLPPTELWAQGYKHAWRAEETT